MQQFTAAISANLTFSREEVEYLAVCAEHHYDHSIRAMVPAGYGAVINGMRNRLLDAETISTSGDYTFREIDRLCKAVEFQEDFMAANLKRQFTKALQKINEITSAVNGLIATLTDDEKNS